MRKTYEEPQLFTEELWQKELISNSSFPLEDEEEELGDIDPS